jgi:hypothetical protein
MEVPDDGQKRVALSADELQVILNLLTNLVYLATISKQDRSEYLEAKELYNREWTRLFGEEPV